jgi:hypothetical protein
VRCPRVCVCVPVRVRLRLRLHARGAAARRGTGGGGPGSGRVPRPPRPPSQRLVSISPLALSIARAAHAQSTTPHPNRGGGCGNCTYPLPPAAGGRARRGQRVHGRGGCALPPFPPSAGALCFAFPPLSVHARLSLSVHSPVGEAAISHGARVCVRVCVRAGPRGGARSWTRRGRERNGERERTRPARWGRRNRQTGPYPGARASGQGGRGTRPPCACVCGGPCGGRGQARFGACGTRGGCEGGRASERRASARGERSDPSNLSCGAFPSRLPAPSPRPTTRPSPHHRCVPSVYVCTHAGSLTGVPEAGGRAARACRRDRKKQGRASSMGAVCARAVPTPGRRGAHARHDPAYPSSQWLHQGEGRPPWGSGAGLWADWRAPGAGAGSGGARDHLGRGRPLGRPWRGEGRPRAGPHARHPRPHTPPGEGARRWRWGWPCARVRARRHSSPLKAAGGGDKEEKKAHAALPPPHLAGG